jgi:hypothetical protein
VLDALVIVYADYPTNMDSLTFGDVSGLCNLDPMLETFSFSGDGRILQRALQATLGAFRWLDEHHLLPYGVASGEEFASGIGAFRKTDTCDVPAMLLAASWMYRLQGERGWGDRLERAFFNAGGAALNARALPSAATADLVATAGRRWADRAALRHLRPSSRGGSAA